MIKEDVITNFDAVKQIIAEYKDQPGCLMPILQKTQEAYGFLPFEIQNVIAEGLDISLSEVYDVATFYSQFTLTKKGKYSVKVCMGTACYVKNSQGILDKLSEILNVPIGGTTPDYRFTLEATRCLGCCGLAPVIMINDDVYGGLIPDDLAAIIDKYRE